jgi:hypothetical protein
MKRLKALEEGWVRVIAYVGTFMDQEPLFNAISAFAAFKTAFKGLQCLMGFAMVCQV